MSSPEETEEARPRQADTDTVELSVIDGGALKENAQFAVAEISPEQRQEIDWREMAKREYEGQGTLPDVDGAKEIHTNRLLQMVMGKDMSETSFGADVPKIRGEYTEQESERFVDDYHFHLRHVGTATNLNSILGPSILSNFS